ncbi:unnamed protein product [Caenorhabditis sp. 36 PRJEB53466]|nr:unnamed protein product [Caenorhabditis sp. 36 PRJEB53466]
MLYEQGETHDGLTVWSPSQRYSRRSSYTCKRICFLSVFAILIFFLGMSVGAFLHASVLPDSFSPLIRIPAFLRSSYDRELNTTIEEINENELKNEEHADLEYQKTSTEDEDSERDDQVESSESSSSEEKKKKTKSKKKIIERGSVIEKEKPTEAEEKKKRKDEEEEEKGFLESNRECSNISWFSSRLPLDVIPTEYELTLHPNLSTGVVKAEVIIKAEVRNRTRLLVLNAENLNLLSFQIKKNDVKQKAEFVKCEVMTQWAWKLKHMLLEGDTVDISVKYELGMKPDLQGLYLSTHVSPVGEKTRSAATQFEPTFARKMLPCFDEPNFKATFQVSIIRDPNHVARSNMNLLVSKEINNSLIKDDFEKSVKMSTYLLAIAVLDGYDYVRRLTRNTTRAIEVRLYAPSDMIKGQSEFGLDTAIRALEFFEHYFNISYPLDKIDLLALDDFSEGAMENWGLVTFRDSALLFNEEKASASAKEHIALIICHEIAHQWFGNLVTMDWWDEIFLNEGFANYMEYKCVEELFPDWHIMTRFYAENVAFSQEPDGFLSSRAIESDDKESLLNLFDAINYHKAAAIIHMVAEMVGQHNFQKALIEYLKKYEYSNAKGVDLWTIVGKHANLHGVVSIPELARAYTTQVGYPLVSVERNGNTIKIHNQTRFLFAEGDDLEKERGNAKWPIPISYKVKDEASPKLHWLQKDDENVEWETTSDEWMILNTGGIGYFKVIYDDETYRKLIEQFAKNHTQISPTDRSMILVDSYDIARTSLLNISVYFDLVEYADKEGDKMVWSIISKQLRIIESLIEDADYIDLFRDFQRTLIMRLYETLKWDEKGATPNQKRMQIDVLEMACRLRIRDCTKQAYQRYLIWITNGTRNPEHHLIALAEGIKQGGTTAWQRIWSSYRSAVSPSERNNIIGALTSTRDVSLVNRILKYCLEGKIKPNLIPRVFAGFALDQVGRNAAWKFFKDHYSQFHSLMGKGSTLLGSCVKCLAESLGTDRELNELKEFLRIKKFEYGQIKMEMTYEQIKLNIQWRKLNEEQLGIWMNSWDERRRSLYRRKRHRHNHETYHRF